MMMQSKYFGTRKTINVRVKPGTLLYVNYTSRKLMFLIFKKAKLFYDKRKQARVQQGH